MHAVLVVAVILLAALSACGADTTALEPTQVISLDGVEGRIDHMAIDEKSGLIYVAALGNNTVEVIDVAAGKRIDSIKGLTGPQGVGLATDSQRVVVASGGDGQCRIYDQSRRLLAHIDGLDDADNVRYDPASKHAIVGYGNGALAIIDPQTAAKVAVIKLDGHPESFQLEEKGNRIFVNIPQAAQVAVVDREKGVVIAKWTLTDARSNFPMALDEPHHRLFLGCRKPAKLLVVNTDTGKTVAVVDIVGDADDVFHDATSHQLYVSGGEGFISVIDQKDADTYSVVSRVATAGGARTSLFLPASGKLFIAVPHRGSQHAELRVYQVRPSKP